MVGRRWLTLGVLLVCALLSLSCIAPCLPFCPSRTGRAPSARPTVPTSDDAAKRFQEKSQGLAKGEFRVEFTEQEVTSYLALQLGTANLLASPQVRFLPGKVVVEGDLSGPIRSHVTLVGTVQTVDGRVQLAFEEASLGAVPLPAAMLTSLSDGISEMIGPSDVAVEIQSVEVLAGRIILTGRKR